MIRVLYVAVALLAVSAGYFMSTQQLSSKDSAVKPKDSIAADAGGDAGIARGTELKSTTAGNSMDLVGRYRPDFKLGSQNGEFVSADDFTGKTVLLNFWATWCTPCREEMPMLVELQTQYESAGLQVVGIALDDVQKVRDFVRGFGISYPILVGSADVMDTNQKYGNLSGALPYSVLVDTDGIIRWQYSGALQHDELEEILAQWL